MKKGFTLVELLAVIVILAIIALIAVPVFLGIINKSKTSSDKEEVNLYTDTVQKTIEKKQMSDANFQPDKCTIKTDGNLECFRGTTSLGIVKVSMKGTKPTSGTIYIEEDDIEYINILLNNKYYYERGILVDDADNNNEISIGDKYSYKVNDTDTFNFYVLSVDGNKVNLIMDRNICEDGTVNYISTNNYCRYTWYLSGSNNTYGPVNAMQKLYAGTKDWDNVPTIELNYTDEQNTDDEEKGYKSLIISNGVVTITGKPTSNTTIIGTSEKPMRVRLPKAIELSSIGCTGDSGSCPVWLMENMTYFNTSHDKYYFNNNNEAYQGYIYGYWLLSSYSGNSTDARYVNCTGALDRNYFAHNGNYGIRPVITVPISYLES